MSIFVLSMGFCKNPVAYKILEKRYYHASVLSLWNFALSFGLTDWSKVNAHGYVNHPDVRFIEKCAGINDFTYCVGLLLCSFFKPGHREGLKE